MPFRTVLTDVNEVERWQTWSRTAPSALGSNTAAGSWTSVWAPATWCGSADPGRWGTRTGPGQRGRPCGSADYGAGGTPPGGQSGSGSTWWPEPTRREKQSGGCVDILAGMSYFLPDLMQGLTGVHGLPVSGLRWQNRQQGATGEVNWIAGAPR